MKQKITKAYVQNHFTYASWIYIMLILFATAGWSLIFSVTRYVPPPEKQLVVYFVADYFNYDNAAKLEEKIREEFPEMEEVGVYNVDVSSAEGQQKFWLMMATGEVDLFIMDRAYVQTFIYHGIAQPLDQALEDGVIDLVEDMDRFFLENTGNEEDPAPHYYAMPTNDLYGMMNELMFDNRKSIMLATTNAGNPEESVRLMQVIYDMYYYEEVPDFVENYDIYMDMLREEGSN